MRKLLTLAAAALAGASANVAFAASASPHVPAALAVLGATAVAAVVSARRASRERQALDEAVGLLAEFRLPLPDATLQSMPAQLQPLVRGYAS